MREITVFNNISLDGYFVDGRGDMRWAHEVADAESTRYASDNAQQGDGALLFGRKTYEMMAAFWPTPQAQQSMPEVAEGMNRREKIVVSRTLTEVGWAGARLLAGPLVAEVARLKAGDGGPIVVMGSGTIVAQLAGAGLIDRYTFVIVPVILGAGRTLFEGVDQKIALRRRAERAFGNGTVVATYEPA